MDEIVIHAADTEKEIKRCDNLFKDIEKYTIIGTAVDTDDEATFMMKFIITLNRMLNQLGCNVIFTKDSISDKMTNTYCYDIKLADSKFMNSYILNMSDDFYRIIETAFTKFDLKFSYNNTRSCVFLNKKN
jgi:hypothetical protein